MKTGPAVLVALAIATGAAVWPAEPPAGGAPRGLTAAEREPARPRTAAAPEAAGHDFAKEARLLFRIVACSGDEPVPAGLEAVVLAHCDALLPLMERYRSKYLAVAGPFLAALEPKGLPTTVVYPFGGGDLVSALTTYAGATEITTLSLEHAGDPRRVHQAEAQRLGDNLRRLRNGISGLLQLSDSTSENLMQLQRGDLPGQLSFFLIGLAIHQLEPVSLRFFRIREDGSLHCLSDAEIEALADRPARHLNAVWKAPDFSEAFSNAELGFRPRGAPAGLVRVHRHIAANLADGPLAGDSGLLRHLEAKGRVAAMTKAASYVLWGKAFSRIRGYLLAHMAFMVSDSTGIPPRYAKAAGFVQDTYGSFSGPFLEASAVKAQDFCDEWSSQPQRALPFRYGYPDVLRQYHLLVTRRPGAGP